MQRRKFLLCGTAAGATALLHISCRNVPNSRDALVESYRAGSVGGAAVPDFRVSLASYGGMPGATPSVLQDAFRLAFSALMENGGGTLFVPPGLYDFGSYASSTAIVGCKDLSNICISAYGATFQATTTATVMPHMFYFFNFENITIAGARFTDPGFSPSVNWKGMYCVGVQANRASSGIRLVDCQAEKVVGLFASNNNASTSKYLSDISIQGEVRFSYYGVGASFIREKVKVDLICHNVRRAFIANALKDADIKVNCSSTADWLGSNGCIALICGGSSMGNVENVRVRVDASGAGIYDAYVHFYHQGGESHGEIRDVDATVNVTDVSDMPTLFMFDHVGDDGVLSSTTRVWERIFLHGKMSGFFAGKIISSASASTSPCTVYVDDNLVTRNHAWALPKYFMFTSRSRNSS